MYGIGQGRRVLHAKAASDGLSVAARFAATERVIAPAPTSPAKL